MGWTGMPSKRRLAPVVTKEGISGSRGNQAAREQEIPIVEVDTTFGRLLGLADGQKLGVLLHLDPPVAHTVNIEPLTPADWESKLSPIREQVHRLTVYLHKSSSFMLRFLSSISSRRSEHYRTPHIRQQHQVKLGIYIL